MIVILLRGATSTFYFLCNIYFFKSAKTMKTTRVYKKVINYKDYNSLVCFAFKTPWPGELQLTPNVVT